MSCFKFCLPLHSTSLTSNRFSASTDSKVESFWGVFKWVSEKVDAFKHKPQSCEVMASMFVRVGLLREVEVLLSTMESQGVLLGSGEIYSDLIEAYVGVGELDRTIAVYDQIRGRVVPSLQCCGVLLDQLVGMRKTQLAFRVCSDMVEMGFDLRDVKATFEGVIRLLCRDGKIQEARDFVKEAMAFEIKPSNLVLNEDAYGYCEKKDLNRNGVFICLSRTRSCMGAQGRTGEARRVRIQRSRFLRQRCGSETR
ncbi:hypothetical protein ACLB2K_067827 [Fragaria x ananassa]